LSGVNGHLRIADDVRRVIVLRLILTGNDSRSNGPDDNEDKKSCACGSPGSAGGNSARRGADDRAPAGTPSIGNPGAASGRAACRSSTSRNSTGPGGPCNSRAFRCTRLSGAVSSSSSCSNGRARARRSRHILAGSHGFPAAARKAGCRAPHGRHSHCRCPIACVRDGRWSLRSGRRRDWDRDRHRRQL
jgi:hypothetical protein